MDLDSIIKLLQENNVLAGYVVVGLLFLILLIFLLIKSFSARKQSALQPPMPSAQAMPKTSAQPNMQSVAMPALVADQPDTKIFLDQLKKVSDESQKVIYKLDTELTEKERIILEKKQYIQELEQQIAEMPVEQILSQQAEKFKKDTERKLAQAKQEASTKSYQMWFFGFLVGLALTAGVVAAYYFLVVKG